MVHRDSRQILEHCWIVWTSSVSEAANAALDGDAADEHLLRVTSHRKFWKKILDTHIRAQNLLNSYVGVQNFVQNFGISSRISQNFGTA